jgi:hypothetical protein
MRTMTARPPFAMHLVRSFFTRGRLKEFPRQAILRKFLAILMLAIIGGFYAAPLLQAASSDPDAGLPACCRRHGKHHCAMMDRYLKSIDSGTPQVRTTPQHCPLYPHSSNAPVVRYDAGLAPSPAIFAQVVSYPAVHPQTHAVYRLSLDRSRQKRGPPSLHLCA